MIFWLSLLGFIFIFSTVCLVGLIMQQSRSTMRARLMRAISAVEEEEDYQESVRFSDRMLRALLRAVMIQAHPRSAGLRKYEHRVMLLLVLAIAASGCVILVRKVAFLRVGAQFELIIAIAAVWIGMRLAASFWIDWHAKTRAGDISAGLIDVLDMWVLCLGSGMSFQSAMVRVGQDEILTSPALREELKVTIQEMLAGCPRDEALRHLVRRCGDSPDMRALVSQIIQSERMGTSLTDTLRVFSESLRFKRRQDAQEMIQQLSVKLAFPLIFFILPALFVVILTPAIIRFMEVFLNR